MARAATIGFALIPLVTAAVMGAVVGVATSISTQSSGATTIGAALPMVVVMMAAIFMMMRVPQLVQQLSGAVVATGTGITEAIQARNLAWASGRIFSSPVCDAFSAGRAVASRFASSEGPGPMRGPAPPPKTAAEQIALWKRPTGPDSSTRK